MGWNEGYLQRLEENASACVQQGHSAVFLRKHPESIGIKTSWLYLENSYQYREMLANRGRALEGYLTSCREIFVV